MKTLVTTFVLLLKISDTCGWTPGDRDALSQSRCTACVENLWIRKKLPMIDGESMGR